MQKPNIASFFDPGNFTVIHVISDPITRRAAIIDSVLDYDPKSGRTSHANADKVIDYVLASGLTADWMLETHAHADHLSAAQYLKEKRGEKIGIDRYICEVQAVFKEIFNAKDMNTVGMEFDQLIDDDDVIQVGQITFHVMHTPGHTPACLTFVVDENAFVGDTLFMPDYGAARCDFPGGDAVKLYRSIQKLLAFPPQTRLHLCHDYPPSSREPVWVTTVTEQKEFNIHLHEGITEAEFVAMHTARDKSLSMPILILPVVQMNARAGKLPQPEDNRVSYLKMPLNIL